MDTHDQDGNQVLTTTIAVPRDLYEQFRALAEGNDSNPRREIRALIKRYVRENERTAA